MKSLSRLYRFNGLKYSYTLGNPVDNQISVSQASVAAKKKKKEEAAAAEEEEVTNLYHSKAEDTCVTCKLI